MTKAFDQDPDNDSVEKVILPPNRVFNTKPTADGEVPFGPADVIRTDQVSLADTVGGVALIDSGQTEI